MIEIAELAAELADKHDVSPASAEAAVDTYAGQINDDPDLYDADTERLTEDGADLVRDQFTAQYASGETADQETADVREVVREKTERVKELRRETDAVIGERDDAIRRALKLGVRVPDVMTDAELKDRSRVYQIRDGRR